MRIDRKRLEHAIDAGRQAARRKRTETGSDSEEASAEAAAG